MKNKFTILVFIFILLMQLCGCKFEESDNLYNFEKPYTGIYQCESFIVGGEELLNNYSSYTIELKADGEMAIKFKRVGSNIYNTQIAVYKFSNNKIILEDEEYKTVLYEKGKVILFYDINGIPLIAKFSR